MASALAEDIAIAGPDQRLGLVQLCERFAVDLVRDLVLEDVELLEDCLVQQSSVLGPGLPVELPRRLEQLECGLQKRSSDFKFVVSLLKLVFELGAFGSDSSQPRSESVLRSVVIGSKVVEILLLPVEHRDPLLYVVAEHPGCGRLVIKRLVHVGANCCREVRAELDRSVVRRNCAFDVIDLGVAS